MDTSHEKISWLMLLNKNKYLGLGNTNGRLALYLISKKKEQSQVHKAEDLLDIICDNFDCPLFLARVFREFRKRNPIFAT